MSKKIEYKCGICGKSYVDIADRITCETKCLDERNRVEEAMRKQKLEAEKAARKQEIEDMYKELHEAIAAYTEDYGVLKLSHKRSYEDIPTLSSLFDLWSF